jgi:hypothetical protein
MHSEPLTDAENSKGNEKLSKDIHTKDVWTEHGQRTELASFRAELTDLDGRYSFPSNDRKNARGQPVTRLKRTKNNPRKITPTFSGIGQP